MDDSLSINVGLDELDEDPYPIYARLRSDKPVAYLPALNMWYVTRHADVQQVLRDPERFRTGTEASLLFDTFGEHMLTTDGARQEYFKGWFRDAFAPAALKARMKGQVEAIVARLIDGFAGEGRAELRSTFAARLPILAMLRLFDLPDRTETDLRHWYDDFEAALANFQWDAGIRKRAAAALTRFHALIQGAIDEARARPEARGMLAGIVHSDAPDRLTDAEICRNAGIIFFGGISTVEALTLNTVYALCRHPHVMERVLAEPALVPAAVEETVRWLSPVQSATRHVHGGATIAGVAIPDGATVNCMLGSANRDEAMFDDPDRFDIDRRDGRRHLAFALGPHFCLGSNLARLEAIAAVTTLLERLPGLRIAPGHPAEVRGFEFRQPRRLMLEWDA